MNVIATAMDVLNLCQAAGNGNRWALDMSSSSFVQSQARDGAAASLSNTSATVTASVWQLFAATATDDSNRASLLQGGNKGTNAVSRPITAPTNTRVSANPLGNNPINGLVAHIAIWNIVLSDSDIASILTNLPSSIQPANLQEYWPLTTGASPEPSLGILGNSLTVTGTSFAADDPYGAPVVLMGQAIF